MNKKFFTTMLLIWMTVSMMVLTAGCGAQNGEPQETTLQPAQTEETEPEFSGESGEDFIREWQLDAKAWSDGNGATVNFSVVPVNYVDGQRAALSVRVGELEAENTNCNWDGTSYTGSVELSGVDGYGYYLVLTDPNGVSIELELASPEYVTDETLVYLGTSLSTYANMVVEDWEANASALRILSGYIHAQMPRLTYNNVAVSVNEAALVLKRDNEEVERKAVELMAGEGSGSYEMTITDQTFSMPSMEEDSQLDLWLEISLNTGDTISVSGGSWYSIDGQLQLAVG